MNKQTHVAGDGMEWRPIEAYDAMKKKPQMAVFYFEATPAQHNGSGLLPTVQCSRWYGRRVCTHWMPLPDAPKESA